MSKVINVKMDEMDVGSRTKIIPGGEMGLKFPYAKESHKFETHMELEWVPA